jgi:hypothetical protein
VRPVCLSSALTLINTEPNALLGSAASGIMGYFGLVPAGGVYATAQSAAMGGYGASIAAGAAQAGAAVSSSAAWLFGRSRHVEEA